MPVFIFLLFVGAFVVWLLLSASYRKLGKFVGRIIGDAKDAMEEEDPDDANQTTMEQADENSDVQ